jgi:HD-GYP domain-containing protein (c-di-GMP phosphodiesterase class II)
MGYWSRLTLLQRFTIATAAITAMIAIVLSVLTVRTVETFAVKDEAQVATETVIRTFAPVLRRSDFGDSLPVARRSLFDALFRAHGISDRLLRIRLWRVDGRLLYSNASEQGGPITGRADLSSPAGYRAFVQKRQEAEKTPGVERFFVPVQVSGDPQTLGAFEIFLDLTLLRQRLAQTQRTIWIMVPAGHLILYGAVFVLVRGASRRILRQQSDLLAAHLGTYHALASAVDLKDSYTGDHSARVSNLATHLGRLLGLEPDILEDVRVGARLHDVGKIGVPDAILAKPGSLTPGEVDIVRKHAEAGYTILRYAPVSEGVKHAVRHTHERWDGTGYPDGLAGAAIPLGARIIAVVDAYEAMASDRPYRRGIPVKEAVARLEANAGAHFDPDIVRSFADMILAHEDYFAQMVIRAPKTAGPVARTGTSPDADGIRWLSEARAQRT